MTREENEVFEELKSTLGVDESPEEKEKTAAGKFIAVVVDLFKRFSKGQVSSLLIKVIPVLLERIVKLESKADRILKILDEKEKK